MGKYRNHREARRNGFDGDQSDQGSEPSYFQRPMAASAPPMAVTAPPIDAEVLWFNVQKGFGFVKLDDGSDAYLHKTKLQAAGHDSIAEGAQLKVRTEAGARGQQVAQVLTVISGACQPGTEVTIRPDLKQNPKPGPQEQEGIGTVKWYDVTRGFGFVSLESGGSDVFVHATALTRSGLATLVDGQKIIIRYAQGQKGLEARTIHLAES